MHTNQKVLIAAAALLIGGSALAIAGSGGGGGGAPSPDLPPGVSSVAALDTLALKTVHGPVAQQDLGITSAKVVRCVVNQPWRTGLVINCFVYGSHNRGIGSLTITVIDASAGTVNYHWQPTL